MPREMDNERLIEWKFMLSLAINGSVRKERVKQIRVATFR